MTDLPRGWENIKLQEFAKKGGGSVNPSKFPDETFELYSVPSFATGKPDVVLGSEIGSIKQVVQERDVLLCKIVPHLNRVWKVGRSNGMRQIASSEWIVFRDHGCDPEYLRLLLTEPSFRERFMTTVSGVGGSLMRAQHKRVSEFHVAIAPLAEQKRIVAKVGSLLARITRARRELVHVPMQVEEAKSQFLSTALRSPSNLPKGWKVRSLAEIAEIQGGVQVGKQRTSSDLLVEVPYLRVANVQRGWLDLSEIKSLSVSSVEKERLLLKPGDVLMNEGGDRDKLGRGWVWEGQIDECIHQNHVFRVRLQPDTLPPKFLSHYANEIGQQYFFDVGTQTTNLASISKKKISALPVVIPPYDEAERIVDVLESRLSKLGKLQKHLELMASLLDTLEQTILSKAFRGELVPQDPNDEPARGLLENVLAEPEKTTAPGPATQPLTIKPDGLPLIRNKRRTTGTNALPKARTDNDVWHKPYLKNLLELEMLTETTDTPTAPDLAKNTPLEPHDVAQALFKISELEIADFYKQLDWEIQTGHIVEMDGRLRAA